jgi:hypothetical protein
MVLADEATPYFPMPAVPESMPLGSQRANYVVEHYWDFCPWKSAFSAPRRMQESLSTFAELLPLAQRDTAMTAVRSLVAQVNKKPDELLSLATMAEAVFYSDTAVVASDEAFLPFVQAVNKNKKIKGEAREHFERLESVITHSAEGLPVPSLKVRLADGSTVALNDTTSSASAYLIFFDKPDDALARFDRVRLTANVAVNRLVDSGNLKPLLLYPGKPDEAWWTDVSTMPATWTVGALEEARNYFDFRLEPAIYVADSSMKITAKFLTVDLLISNCERLGAQLSQQN